MKEEGNTILSVYSTVQFNKYFTYKSNLHNFILCAIKVKNMLNKHIWK